MIYFNYWMITLKNGCSFLCHYTNRYSDETRAKVAQVGATAVETCGVILATLYPRLAEMIKLTKSWSQSLFRRMKFVQRKVTKAARHTPADPAEVKDKFVTEVNDYRVKHDIPKRLTLNADQTGVFMTPCKRYTMAPRGAKQVKGQGLNLYMLDG